MGNKEVMGGVGGAVAGYFFTPQRPVMGAIAGYFVGFLIGRQLDKKDTAAAIAAGEGAGIIARGSGI